MADLVRRVGVQPVRCCALLRTAASSALQPSGVRILLRDARMAGLVKLRSSGDERGQGPVWAVSDYARLVDGLTAAAPPQDGTEPRLDVGFKRNNRHSGRVSEPGRRMRMSEMRVKAELRLKRLSCIDPSKVSGFF